ncbi:gas vesicle protein K [Segnochrobactrum spirostomi]|nr:gas vesicle protein K [Segnochrobactrum spirostomi]
MLVETLRQVVEQQAIRRVEGGNLTEEEVERLGLALLRLEQKMLELRKQFGLSDDDLALKLNIPLDTL